MNVLVSLDDNYICPLLVMLNSLFKNNKDCDIVVYVMHQKLSKKNIRYIKAIIKENHGKYQEILFENKIMCELNEYGHLTSAAYLRLFAPLVLPKSLDRIIYLDPDMIVLDSLKPIYEMELKECLFAASPDVAGNELGFVSRRDIKLPQKNIYFNSGVLLFNLKEIFLMDYSKILLEYLMQPRKYRFLDQDVLNDLFRNKIMPFSNSYNYSTRDRCDCEKVLPVAREYCGYKEKYIIHFMGAQKPWKDNYFGKYMFIYFTYSSVIPDKRIKVIILNNLLKSFIKRGGHRLS